MIHIVQILVAFAVGMTAIYFAEHEVIPHNPFLIGAWSFMAAYATGWALKSLTRR